MDETDEYVDVHKRYYRVFDCKDSIAGRYRIVKKKLKMIGCLPDFLFAESVWLQLQLLHQWHELHQFGG